MTTKQQLFWPPLKIKYSWVGWVLIVLSAPSICIFVGSLLGILLALPLGMVRVQGDLQIRPNDVLTPIGSAVCVLGMLAAGISIVINARSKKKQAMEQRQVAIEATHSVLMSGVEYVGGHPLVSQAGVAVLGLSPRTLTLYAIGKQNAIAPIALIPLEDIVKAGMGRPKSAREVYDEDYGYTVDVYEHSPFLSVIFKLDEKTYRASFQAFESPHTPQEWYNRITALKYQLEAA